MKSLAIVIMGILILTLFAGCSQESVDIPDTTSSGQQTTDNSAGTQEVQDVLGDQLISDEDIQIGDMI